MPAYQILKQFHNSVLREEQLHGAIHDVRKAVIEDFKRELDAGKAPIGECAYCDKLRMEFATFHPSHNASPRCESGKRNHCTCDTCF